MATAKLHTQHKFLYTHWLEMTVEDKYMAGLDDLLIGCRQQNCKIPARNRRCGIFNSEKKDIVKLNEALTTIVCSISEEAKPSKRQISNQKRQWRAYIKAAKKMKILPNKAKQVSIVYLPYENRWEVI